MRTGNLGMAIIPNIGRILVADKANGKLHLLKTVNGHSEHVTISPRYHFPASLVLCGWKIIMLGMAQGSPFLGVGLLIDSVHGKGDQAR